MPVSTRSQSQRWPARCCSLVTALFKKANEIEAGRLDEVDAGIGATRR